MSDGTSAVPQPISPQRPTEMSRSDWFTMAALFGLISKGYSAERSILEARDIGERMANV